MEEIKSLQKQLEATNIGKERLPILCKLSLKMLPIHIENAFGYAREAEALAIKVEDKCGLAEAKRMLGMCYYFIANHQESLGYLVEAKSMYSACDNHLGVANSLNSIGVLYIALTELEKAILSFNEALVIYRVHGTDKDISKALCNLSIPYKTLGDYDKAIELLDASLEIDLQLGDKASAINAMANKAGVYYHLDKFQESLEMFTECMHHYQREHNRPFYANTLMSVAGCYNGMKDYAACLKYLQLALREYTSLDMKRQMAGVYNDMGNTLASIGGFEEAERYFKRSLALLEEIGIDGEIYSVACHSMGATALQNKDYEKAEKYLLKGYNIALEKGVARVIPESHKALADLYDAVGHTEKARYHREQIMTVAA